MYSFVGDTRRWDSFTIQDAHTYALKLHKLFPDRTVQLTCKGSMWVIIVSVVLDGYRLTPHYIYGIGDYCEYLEQELLKR